MKRFFCICLVFSLMLCLAACGEEAAAVYVQSVKDLSAMGGIAPGDRFPGLVVSENVAQIQKDADKTVAELLVKEGDDVQEGQELFRYDTDELQLNLDKQKLELEQLQAMADNYTQQIKELEAQRETVSDSDRLAYTVQIQTLQVDLKEAQLNIQNKQTEVAQSESILANAAVTAPVSGRVQTINESGTDNYGNPTAYITIQQAGSYRIKGSISELQLGGIMEGTQIKILSRTDETQCWYGTVSLVDYENATQENGNEMYYGAVTDEMTTASRYPFYVELEDTTGLILGQHVYLQVDTGDAEAGGLRIGSFFICFEEDGSTYVWAEKKGKLEKRTVTLGEYDAMTDTYGILDGLSEADHIAFPDVLCAEGVPTSREPVAEAIVPEGEVVMP